MVGDEAFVVLIQGDVVEQSWFEFGGQANILDRLRPKGRGCQIVTRVIRFGGSCRLSARLSVSVYIPDEDELIVRNRVVLVMVMHTA